MSDSVSARTSTTLDNVTLELPLEASGSTPGSLSGVAELLVSGTAAVTTVASVVVVVVVSEET